MPFNLLSVLKRFCFIARLPSNIAKNMKIAIKRER